MPPEPLTVAEKSLQATSSASPRMPPLPDTWTLKSPSVRKEPWISIWPEPDAFTPLSFGVLTST